MAISRRMFVRSLGTGAAAGLVAEHWPGGWVSARGREGLAGASAPAGVPVLDRPAAMRLDSNENPNGPSARALEAIRLGLSEANRYPFDPFDQITAAIAQQHGVAPANILVGVGSTEILQIAADAYTGEDRSFVSAAPTYGMPASFAQQRGAAVTAVPVDAHMRLDLAAMRAAASGAGLVYLCNPNNPTATVRSAADVADFVRAVTRGSAAAHVLVDEAYFEYVDDPSYATAVPLALENRRVLVTRTFSKIYGMAGLRIGYGVAHADTIRALQPFKLRIGVNILAIAGALGSLGDTAHVDQQRRLNGEAKAYTRRLFEHLGYTVVPSQANFMLVDIRRDSRTFQAACAARGVLVGRPFPPLTTCTRISLGTLAEMRRAGEVFRQVLAGPPSTVGHG